MTLEQLKQQYDILAEVDLGHWHDLTYSQGRQWLMDQCQTLHRQEYAPRERLLFVNRRGDFYVRGHAVGLITRNLQVILDELQISNWFVILASSNPDLDRELQLVGKTSNCDEPISAVSMPGEWSRTDLDKSPSTIDEIYRYGSVNPLKMSLDELTERENFLLTNSRVFCIYPWIHLNANPDGQAYPCCMTDHGHSVGNCKTHTLEQIWNGDKMKQVRLDMLNEQSIPGCNRCYEQEQSGFFSGRLSANKHHGHHVGRISETAADGSEDRFEMVYWDIRFSNL